MGGRSEDLQIQRQGDSELTNTQNATLNAGVNVNAQCWNGARTHLGIEWDIGINVNVVREWK